LAFAALDPESLFKKHINEYNMEGDRVSWFGWTYSEVEETNE
jgi:hypothetical protein